jgi:hypothetical protein
VAIGFESSMIVLVVALLGGLCCYLALGPDITVC